MSNDGWDEIRIAYHVARLGTVSGAAEVLGVHHATVIRHIDALEARLGARLFQRHARGYTATEAGRDLLRVAKITDDQLSQLASRIRGQGETILGDLTVTSLADIAPLMTPALASFQSAHPGLIVRYLTGERLFRLEYGEAHVAVRAGAVPDQPDNVVQPLVTLNHALYAARSYADRRGLPTTEADLARHIFVADDTGQSRAPFLRWLREAVPADRISWRASQPPAQREAVLAGAALGFLPVFLARRNAELIEVLPPRPEWASSLWLVTHVDLHRSAKVQSFLAHLKAATKTWSEL